jgi:hypothetical protein
MSADTLLSTLTDKSQRDTRSTPSSPTKRQLSLLDTPIQKVAHSSNKENWDPVLKAYSTDRQSKKYRSVSSLSIFPTHSDRVPLSDITSLFQTRLEEASRQQQVFLPHLSLLKCLSLLKVLQLNPVIPSIQKSQSQDHHN